MTFPVYPVVGTTGWGMDYAEWLAAVFPTAAAAHAAADEWNRWLRAHGLHQDGPAGPGGYYRPDPGVVCPFDRLCPDRVDAVYGARYRPDPPVDIRLSPPAGEAELLAWSVVRGDPDWALYDKLQEDRTAAQAAGSGYVTRDRLLDAVAALLDRVAPLRYGGGFVEAATLDALAAVYRAARPGPSPHPESTGDTR